MFRGIVAFSFLSLVSVSSYANGYYSAESGINATSLDGLVSYQAKPSSSAPTSISTAFYAGIQGGLSLGSIERKAKDESIYDYTFTSKDKDYAANGVNGGLFLGFGGAFANGFYLGAEGYGALTSMGYKSTTSPGDLQMTVKIKDYLGLDLMPGYVVNKNVLLYGRVGAIFGKLEVKANTPVFYQTNSVSKTLPGLHLGLGCFIPLSEHIFARAEYAFSWYKSTHASELNTDYDSFSNDYSPLANEINLGILYRF